MPAPPVGPVGPFEGIVHTYVGVRTSPKKLEA